MGKFGWLIPTRKAAPEGEGAATSGASLFSRRTPDDDARDLAKRYKITSMVGEGMIVAGQVMVRDSLMVFGQLRAGVRVTGEESVLLLREGSMVLGDVIAPTVLVKGNVRGTIQGKTVRLYPGSKVFGTIKADNLIVDEGATIFNRSVQAHTANVDPAEAAQLQGEPPAIARPVAVPAAASAPAPEPIRAVAGATGPARTP